MTEDTNFANAIVTRRLWDLPPLLPSPTLEDTVTCLQSCVRAANPRASLLLRTLRKTLSLCAHDNDNAIPLVSPYLHQLTTNLPSANLAGDVAAGLLLLFAHGLGQLPAEMKAIANPKAKTHHQHQDKLLVIMLGFAGGTPADVRQYSSRLYSASEHDIMVVTASEIPEVYTAAVSKALRATRGRTKWVIHLFSKAGFLMCGRMIEQILRKQAREEEIRTQTCQSVFYDATSLPSAIVWDSSPGSLSNYDEFIQGTWQSAELVAKRGQFQYSVEARARMNAILTSEAYPYSVRDSYAPMHNLMPFPNPNPNTNPRATTQKTKHLFLFSEKDPVCSPVEIRKYATECVTKEVSRCVVVSGTHCDGLFWSGKAYVEAVRELLESL